jgi:TfoX/Sxy family transcriptional regulator of competence genes
MITTDEELVLAIRRSLGSRVKYSEVRMFGGTGFLLDGKIFVGTSKQGLLVRVGKEKHAEALKHPGTKPMVMGGRVSEGFIFVNPKGLDAAALKKWLQPALAFVRTLPAKPTKMKAKAKARAKTRTVTKQQRSREKTS